MYHDLFNLNSDPTYIYNRYYVEEGCSILLPVLYLDSAMSIRRRNEKTQRVCALSRLDSDPSGGSKVSLGKSLTFLPSSNLVDPRNEQRATWDYPSAFTAIYRWWNLDWKFQKAKKNIQYKNWWFFKYARQTCLEWRRSTIRKHTESLPLMQKFYKAVLKNFTVYLI